MQATSSTSSAASAKSSPWRLRGTSDNIRSNEQRKIVRARRLQAVVLTTFLLIITVVFFAWGGWDAFAPLAPSIPLSLWLIWFGSDVLRSDELATE